MLSGYNGSSIKFGAVLSELINSSDSLIEVSLMYKCATEINGVSMVLMLDVTSGGKQSWIETYERKIIYGFREKYFRET